MQNSEFIRNIDPARSIRLKRRMLAPLFSIYTKPEKWLYARGIFSPANLTLPDFIGIGAPQGGTTWLYENLRHHPELFLSEKKEIRYFSIKFHESLRFSYARNFKAGGRKKKGEITPEYSILPLERIRFIRQILPDVRLIFIMRNPVDRVWSAARRVLSRLPDRKFEEITEEELQIYFKLPHCRNLTDYTTIFDRWLSVFPAGQLHVAFFDEIAQQPRELLRKIFLHVGVSENVDWSTFPCEKVVNKNPDAEMPPSARRFLQEMYRDQINALHGRFGGSVAKWLC